MYLRIPIALQYCGSLINTIFVSELYKILYVTRMTIFKSVQKQRNLTFVVQTVIWWKVQYQIWNPNKIPSQGKKNIQIGPETTKFDFCDPDSHLGKG